MTFKIEEINKEYFDVKSTIINVISKYNIADFSNRECKFSAKINDDKTFKDILRLFYYLYILEKLYSQKYPISNSKKSKRYLKSAISKDKQAYLLKIGNYTIFVTYFEYHNTHINPFYKRGILAGEFKGAFKKIERQKHTTSIDDYPIILMFRYHLSERSHIINRLDRKPSIDLSSFSCNKKSACDCLEKIENIFLDDSENRECNLRILGGSQAFFELDYELVKNLINLEFLGRAGYEPIFNFLLGCYLSDKLGAEFNSNVRIKFDSIIIEDVDIILTLENEIAMIETTREHDVCGKSDEEMSKLKKIILQCAPMYSAINKSADYANLKFALITLTPEERFTECTHYEDFIKQLFNFTHIGIPKDIAEDFLEFKYFSPRIVDGILWYQLEKIIDFLSS